MQARAGPFAIGQWTCVELESVRVPADGGLQKGTLHGFIDGSERSDLLLSGWLANADVSQVTVWVDATMPANSPAYDVWVDELIADSKPIGCGN